MRFHCSIVGCLLLLPAAYATLNLTPAKSPAGQSLRMSSGAAVGPGQVQSPTGGLNLLPAGLPAPGAEPPATAAHGHGGAAASAQSRIQTKDDGGAHRDDDVLGHPYPDDVHGKETIAEGGNPHPKAAREARILITSYDGFPEEEESDRNEGITDFRPFPTEQDEHDAPDHGNGGGGGVRAHPTLLRRVAKLFGFVSGDAPKDEKDEEPKEGPPGPVANGKPDEEGVVPPGGSDDAKSDTTTTTATAPEERRAANRVGVTTVDEDEDVEPEGRDAETTAVSFDFSRRTRHLETSTPESICTNGTVTYEGGAATSGTCGTEMCCTGSASACDNFNGAVCKDGSCNGNLACADKIGNVTNGCISSASCYEMNGTVINGCSGGSSVCYSKIGDVRDGCFGKEACWRMIGNVDGGCHVKLSCFRMIGNVEGGCDGLQACRSAEVNVSYACFQEDACYNKKSGNVVGTSVTLSTCNGTRACTYSSGEIGPEACSADYACSFSSGEIGPEACSADYACAGTTEDVPEGCCTDPCECANCTALPDFLPHLGPPPSPPFCDNNPNRLSCVNPRRECIEICNATNPLPGEVYERTVTCAQTTPEESILDLMNDIDGGILGSDQSGTALVAKLDKAYNSLTGGDTLTACNLLSAFTNHVKAQRDKQIPDDYADSLLGAAETIHDDIGCTEGSPNRLRVRQRGETR